jgi:hypothetical protein
MLALQQKGVRREVGGGENDDWAEKPPGMRLYFDMCIYEEVGKSEVPPNHKTQTFSIRGP